MLCVVFTFSQIDFLSSFLYLFLLQPRGRGLTHLDLSGCALVSDVGVRLVLKANPNLRRLHVARCPRITDATASAVALNCPEIARLDISECVLVTDDGLRYLTGHCKLLKTLIAKGCGLLRGKGFLAETLSGSTLINICFLHTVDLTGCAGLPSAALSWIADSCQDLKHLLLSDCPRASDEGVVQIVTLHPALETLTLSRCPRITDAALAEIGEHCKVREKLNSIRVRWDVPL